MKQPDRVSVLDKAFDLLEALAERPNQTVAELAEGAAVTKAAAYRILSTLEARGYVVTYQRVRHYSIGHAFHMYMQAARRADRLIEAARPEMQDLLDAFGETVNLGTLAHQAVLYVDVLQSTQSLRATSEIGSFDALYSTALGKAMLSRMPRADREAMLKDAELVALTEYTVVDPKALLDGIDDAAAKGYALDDQENEIGMRCVASPIVNADGWPVAAISVSGPASRMTPAAIENITALLIGKVQTISGRLART